MTMVLGGFLSLVLPWLAGALVVRLALASASRSALIALGYGYFVGALGTTVTMRLLSLGGARWRWELIAGALGAIAIAAWWCARREPLTRRGELPAGKTARLVFGLACALLALRLSHLALEVLWRPLLPFDAWTQWADKARVWYEHGRLVRFVSADVWLAHAPALWFTDPHPAYPPAVPLLQAWTALALGVWDDARVNLPWIALGVSLALAFYARLRQVGSGPAGAIAGTYLLVSMPFLDIHLALAGLADVFVGVGYFLALAALWAWTRTRDRGELALALVTAIGCAMMKIEGLFWAATLVPAALVALRPRMGLALLAALGIAAMLAFAFGPGELRVYGYVLRPRFTDVSAPLLQHLFVMDNWHLFWYAVVAVVATQRRALLRPGVLPLNVAMLGAAGVVVVVFFFTSAAGGVADESLVSRLLLQVVPALAFYLGVVLREAWAAASAPAPVAAARASMQPANTAEL